MPGCPTPSRGSHDDRARSDSMPEPQVPLDPARGQRRLALEDGLGDRLVLLVALDHPLVVEGEDPEDHAVGLVAELAHDPEDLLVAQELAEEGVEFLVQRDASRHVAPRRGSPAGP